MTTYRKCFTCNREVVLKSEHDQVADRLSQLRKDGGPGGTGARFETEVLRRRIVVLEAQLRGAEETLHIVRKLHAEAAVEQATAQGQLFLVRQQLAAAQALAVRLRKELNERPSGAATGGVPAHLWRFIVGACHPDKHNNSNASAAATRWLLDNRPNTGRTA